MRRYVSATLLRQCGAAYCAFAASSSVMHCCIMSVGIQEAKMITNYTKMSMR